MTAGTCRVCHRVGISVNADGTLRAHGPRTERCPGSGKRPRGPWVSFACLTDAHDTCTGHDGTAPKACECPDLLHVPELRDHALNPVWAADRPMTTGDIPDLATEHACEWKPADGGLACACGARIADGVATYPDDLEPAGHQLAIGGIIHDGAWPETVKLGTHPSPYAWPPLGRQAGKTAAAEAFTGLTDEERRQVIAGHLHLEPGPLLAAVEAIVRRRLEP